VKNSIPREASSPIVVTPRLRLAGTNDVSPNGCRSRRAAASVL
jgi:hypothetical protein